MEFSDLPYPPNTMINPLDAIKQMFPTRCHDQIFLVGGCVRDMLLKQAASDVDLISTLTPDELISRGFRLVTGKSTVPVWFCHDDISGSIEATLIPDMTGLSADLARRDFTINAMAMTLGGELIDPLHGEIDLGQRLLRACNPQAFSADPLRIFRALRFEADGWGMSPDTENLIRERDWSVQWAAIPMERFSREMLKSLPLAEPGRFFQRMLELTIGESYLPEIFLMPHIPAGPLIHHPEGDLFSHSIQVLQRVSAVSSDSLTRFCAMFHDIGKLATNPSGYPKHHGHDQAGFKLAEDICQRLRLPAQYGKALSWVSRLHGTFNLWDQLRDATKLRVAERAVKAGIVEVLPVVAAADKAGGREPEEWEMVVRIATLSSRELDVTPQQLEGMKPAKRCDYILQKRVDKLRSIRTASTGISRPLR